MNVCSPALTPRQRYTFFIEEDQRRAIAEIKARVGISESEQIRRAIEAWINEHGVKKAQGKRAATRKPR